MKTVRDCLVGEDPPAPPQREALAGELGMRWNARVYASSVCRAGGAVLAFARQRRASCLLVAGPAEILARWRPWAQQVQGLTDAAGPLQLLLLEAKPPVAALVREALPWTAPLPMGFSCSVGLGDRIGLATPGHVRAVRGRKCRPYFAQQSIREMTRTERTPLEVVDAATWGVFQTGWREGFGSDADHLKSPEDIDACDAAGFTMFTIDPGQFVCDEADTLDEAALRHLWDTLPWPQLETGPGDLRRTYVDKRISLDGGGRLTFDELTCVRAAVKYGRAVAHTTRMYRHLKSRRAHRPFELEISVDETRAPTTPAEHYFVASELKRLGVQWIGLAPRFVGDFEKGVDYKGDLEAFRQSFAEHAAVARSLGPYKLSIHSGSDKFTVYPVIAALADGAVHLKTAGTSYLEALRVIARHEPALFREILGCALESFRRDRASYHVSADPARVPSPGEVPDGDLAKLIDQHDARQVLHVTFGSVLTYRAPDGRRDLHEAITGILIDHEEDHAACLERHLGRHLSPFAGPVS